ncbi:MAG: hypothetical protein ACOCWM_02845 [Cyclobacteriaceae bacterium]
MKKIFFASIVLIALGFNLTNSLQVKSSKGISLEVVGSTATANEWFWGYNCLGSDMYVCQTCAGGMFNYERIGGSNVCY